ncbi:XrtA system polysaccharide chain length determinant [Piscinibacter sp.]|uniref:XrtA system polysaccharide chain length determinant n=1 Tax=Piscinibacter sp. TaxID=1903157 RepID=UPI0039E37B89
MQPDSPLTQLKELLKGAWRSRRVGVIVAWALALLFVPLVLLMPDRYQATARVYIDTHTVLKPLMAGLAFQPDFDQQVRMLARTLISRPNVERLRADTSIGWAPASEVGISREVDALMKAIRIVSEGSNVYTIVYRDTDAGRAQRLVATLVSSFSSTSNADKQRDSEEARKFIDEEIRQYEVKLSAAENALKDFKLRNFGVSGVSGQDYFARISSLSEDVARLQSDLQAAEASRDALRRELSAQPEQLPVEALPGQMAAAPTELDTRLEAQKRQLDELLRRYTDEHPDVLAARKTIAQIEAQKRVEAEAARKRREADGKTPAPTNPVYQRIRVSLAEAEASVASLRGRLTTQQARLEQVRGAASKVPQVEAELAQLNRDYDVIRKNYQALVERRESASIGVKLDQTASMAEFRTIDPARAATTPVFPNKVGLAAIGFVLALVGGLVAAILYSRVHPVVDSTKVLQELSGRPVVGRITLIPDAATIAAVRHKFVLLGGAVLALCAWQVAWIGWLAVRSIS